MGLMEQTDWYREVLGHLSSRWLCWQPDTLSTWGKHSAFYDPALHCLSRLCK